MVAPQNVQTVLFNITNLSCIGVHDAMINFKSRIVTVCIQFGTLQWKTAKTISILDGILSKLPDNFFGKQNESITVM